MKNRRRRQAKRRHHTRRLIDIERSIVLQDPINQRALTAIKRRILARDVTWPEYKAASRRRCLPSYLAVRQFRFV
jgi:hypothetical protein